MAKDRKRIPRELEPWIEARKRFGLSHAQVQMARELGLNPRKLGKLANHDQEPWKAPLPEFIERLYAKRFGRSAPIRVVPMEVRAREIAAKKAERRERRRRARSEGGAEERAPRDRNDAERVRDPDDAESGSNFRRCLLEVVETQEREGEPPETGRALARLVADGYSRSDAMILVAQVVAAEMFEIVKQGREHDRAKYAKALDALPSLLYEDAPGEQLERLQARPEPR